MEVQIGVMNWRVTIKRIDDPNTEQKARKSRLWVARIEQTSKDRFHSLLLRATRVAEVERDRGRFTKEAMTKKSSGIFSDEVKGDRGEQSSDLEAPLEDACRSRPIDQSAVASMVPLADREQTSGTEPPPLPWCPRRRSIWLDVKVSAGRSTLMVQDPRFGGRVQSPGFLRLCRDGAYPTRSDKL